MRKTTARLLLITASLVAVLQPAAAQSLTPEAQYQQDLLRCEQEQSVVDMEACRKEAAAALQATRTNDLGNGSNTDYQANERARCMALPDNQRQDCLLLLSGQNTQVKGSVSQGGVLRETTIIIPAPAPVPANARPANVDPEAAIPSAVKP